MAVNVWHLLVHEGGVGILVFCYKQTSIWTIQVVRDSAFAQRLRVSVFVGPLTRIEKLTGLWVIHVQLTAHKRVVQFPNIGIERFIGQHRYRPYQAHRSVVHLTACLVAELSADETLVAVSLVLVHLLAEA